MSLFIVRLNLWVQKYDIKTVKRRNPVKFLSYFIAKTHFFGKKFGSFVFSPYFCNRLTKLLQ